MSSPAVSATHHQNAFDDWNTIDAGGRERSLKTARDVEQFVGNIRNGNIEGLSGSATVDGHTVTVGGVSYDLEQAEDTARLAADLRDGVLDGKEVGSAAYLDEGLARTDLGMRRERALVVDGKRVALNSADDVEDFVLALQEGSLGGLRAGSGIDYQGGKILAVGGRTYDLSTADARQAMALDVMDGVLDGATAVDPVATGTGVGTTAGVASAGSTTGPGGYPTLAPGDDDYCDAWTDWMKTHTYEEFVTASERGAIPDENKLFADNAFANAVKHKGDQSARVAEMKSYMQRLQKEIFDHISRAWA